MRPLLVLIPCLITLACASAQPAGPDTLERRDRLGRAALADQRFEDAYEHLAEAIALAEPAGLGGARLADSLAAFARAARATGHYDEALRALHDSLQLLQEAGGDQRIERRILLEGALVYRDLGRLEEAEAAVRRYLALAETSEEEAPQELGRALNLLAGLMLGRSELEEAAKLWRESLELQRAAGSAAGPDLLSRALCGLAEAELLRGRSEDAAALLAESAALDESSREDRAACLSVEARSQAELGRPEEAERRVLEALDLLEPGSPEAARVAARLVDAASLSLVEAEKSTELTQIAERAIALGETSSPGSRVLLGRAVTRLGGRLERAGEAEQAQHYILKGREIAVLAVGPKHPAVIEPSLQVVSTLLQQNRLDEAAELALDLLALTEELGPGAAADRVRVYLSLASVATRRGDGAAADAAYRSGLELQEAARRAGIAAAPPNVEGRLLAMLGQSELRRGELEVAERYLHHAAEVFARDPEGPPFEASTRAVLASYLLRQGRVQDGLEQAKRALELFEKEKTPSAESLPAYALMANVVSRSLGREGQTAEAEAILRRVLGRLEGADFAQRGELGDLYGLLSRVLASQGKAEEAVAMGERAVAVLEANPKVAPLLFARVLSDVAASRVALKHKKEAETLYLRSLAVARRDPDHKRSEVFARASHEAALIYLERRDLESALFLLREAKEAYELAELTGNPGYLLLLESLAQVQAATGSPGEAVETAERLASILEERSSGEHPSLPKLREWIGQLRQSAGR